MDRFRKDVIESTKINDQDSGIDPFIALLCNHVFRINNLEKEKIAIMKVQCRGKPIMQGLRLAEI